MHVFHIFSVFSTQDVYKDPTIQRYDFVVHANTLMEAAEQIKGHKCINGAEAVWGSTRVHSNSLIVSPTNKLHQLQSRSTYEYWLNTRDPKHYISIKEWL